MFQNVNQICYLYIYFIITLCTAVTFSGWHVNKLLLMWCTLIRHKISCTFNLTFDIVTYIKVKRLAWAEHLVHMNDRTPKKIFNTKPVGVKSVGRPKLQWEDGVDQDIRILGVKN